jgi:hypothetical protein
VRPEEAACSGRLGKQGPHQAGREAWTIWSEPASRSALAAFAGVAAIGFRTSPWFVAAGLAAHGLFDFFRGGLIANPGVPAWWPNFCLSFDLVAAAWLAWRLVRRGGGPSPSSRTGFPSK